MCKCNIGNVSIYPHKITSSSDIGCFGHYLSSSILFSFQRYANSIWFSCFDTADGVQNE